MIGHSLRNMFGSLGFTYDFASCQNNGSPENFQNVLWKTSFKHANRYQSFLGGTPTKYQKQSLMY